MSAIRKLSDLRPCDKCHGKLVPMFYVLTLSRAMVNANAAELQA